MHILEELVRRHHDFSPHKGDFHETLDALRELPIRDENSFPVVLPDTTNVLPLPDRYADVQHEIVGVFPANPIQYAPAMMPLSHRQSDVYPDDIRTAIASWSELPESVK